MRYEVIQVSSMRWLVTAAAPSWSQVVVYLVTPWQRNRLRETYRRELVRLAGSSPPYFRLEQTFIHLVARTRATGGRIPRSMRKWIGRHDVVLDRFPNARYRT